MSYTLFREKAPGIMRDLMRDFDLDVESAAAIVGNLGHESGGFRFLQEKKPLVPGSRGGWGWAQWTGPRRRAFEAWVAARNLDPAGDEANYGFLVEELRGSERRAIPAVKAADGLRAKVEAFERAFERAGIKHYPARVRYAQEALAAYDGRPVAAPSSTRPRAPASPRLPVPADNAGLAKPEVEAVQKRLRELGFFMVGKVDGLWGVNTTAAIAAFQATAGLPVTGGWDAGTRTALYAAGAPSKPISEDRARTTSGDLVAQGSSTVIAAKEASWGAKALGIVSALLAVLSFAAENWDQARDLAAQFAPFMSWLPAWAGWVPIVLASLYLYSRSQAVIRARVEAERSGMHNGEPDPAPSPPVTHGPDGPGRALPFPFSLLVGR